VLRLCVEVNERRENCRVFFLVMQEEYVDSTFVD
jgi:hypothetical protein